MVIHIHQAVSETTTTTTTTITTTGCLSQACPFFLFVSPVLRDGPLRAAHECCSATKRATAARCLEAAVDLAELTHRSSRGQRMARVGRWVREEVHGRVPGEPTPQAAGAALLFLEDDEPPAVKGTRPNRLADVRPQERVPRCIVEQIVDSAPVVPLLHAPCCAGGGLCGGSAEDPRQNRCLTSSRSSKCPRLFSTRSCSAPDRK